MKALNELVKDCNSAVKNYIALKEEDEKLKADLKEIVLKNWQIVKSSVADFEQIRKMLISCFGHSRTDVLGTFAFTYDNDVSVTIASVNSYWIESPKLALHKGNRGIVDTISNDYWQKENPFREEEIPVWAELLRTEEDANNLVEAISKYYINVMEYYLNEVIPVSEEKMRASIENVKSLLSDSHTIEQKEDGTVEIRLGGKTYVGTLKEE